METKKKKNIVKGLIAALILLLVIFAAGRYGWRLFGFSLCESAGIESVEVTDGQVRLVGFHPGLNPQGYIGYHAEEENGKLYVGFRFDGLFGFFNKGDFDITIPVESKITEVVVKGRENEYVIWEAEAAEEPAPGEENGVDGENKTPEGENTVEDNAEQNAEQTGDNSDQNVEQTEDSAGQNAEQAGDNSDQNAGQTGDNAGISEAYAEIIGQYQKAVDEQWGGQQLMDAGMSIIVRSITEDVGYMINDIDGDGVSELFIGSAADDEFYGKLALALYTLDENGDAIQLFCSMERDRYYYAGGIYFANLGSASADNSYVTTLKLEDKEMIDMTYTTDPADYVQAELTMFK